jgi:N-sulfoglucosamine sulfohydrolase
MPDRPPNLIYIHSHDTGRCTEPYGFPVSMPAFRRFAASGMTFRQAFSAAPTCSPSRAALLTGMAPHSAGMIGLAHRGFDLHDPSQHLASFLSANGYRTILAGHQHVTRRDPRELGYDAVFESGQGHVATVAPLAAAFLRESEGANTPFFLDVGFDEAHRPFHAADASAGNYVALLPGIPDTAATRHDVAQFHASLRKLDRGVGIVLDALDDSGQAENTIVILTTDHGPPFPGMKATLTDAGIGVGLILRAPDMKYPGSVSDALVSQIDLFPTICDLAGLEPPPWLQGVSLAPLIDQTSNHVRHDLFAEVTFHAAYEPQRAIRTDRWTYIRRFDERSRPVLPNIDDSPVLDYLLENGWAERTITSTSLFDNALDPLQRNNLAGDRTAASVEEDLSNRLADWMRATGDPLLFGPVALPSGALVNRASDSSPGDPLVDSSFR